MPADIVPMFNPNEKKVLLGNLVAGPFSGGLATTIGGGIGGMLAMRAHGHPEIGKSVQSLFGPHPLHAGAYGSILGWLVAKAATERHGKH